MRNIRKPDPELIDDDNPELTREERNGHGQPPKYCLSLSAGNRRKTSCGEEEGGPKRPIGK
jgi:hypothetical protein